MNYIKLGDICTIKTGKLNANASSEKGKYPFFTCSSNPLRIDTYSFDCECVLIAGNGDLNVKYYNGKFDAYQRTYVIETKKEKYLTKFIYLFLKSKINELRNNSIGGVIKYIRLQNLTELLIPDIDIEIQNMIVCALFSVDNCIKNKNNQMRKLDNLIKSQFVEMFGDPIQNDKEWATDIINNVAPSQSYKGTFDDKVWLLNLDMVESNSGKILDYVYENINSVGNSTCTFDEENVLYSKLRPYLNKVVIPNQKGYATSELVPLKPDKNRLNRYFLAYLLRSDQFVKYISEKVAGAKMPRVSMDMFRSFDLILPPIELQNKFEQFVKQVDKQKFEVKEQLAKLEELQNSLMKEYFK